MLVPVYVSLTLMAILFGFGNSLYLPRLPRLVYSSWYIIEVASLAKLPE